MPEVVALERGTCISSEWHNKLMIPRFKNPENYDMTMLTSIGLITMDEVRTNWNSKVLDINYDYRKLHLDFKQNILIIDSINDLNDFMTEYTKDNKILINKLANEFDAIKVNVPVCGIKDGVSKEVYDMFGDLHGIETIWLRWGFRENDTIRCKRIVLDVV